MEQMAFAFLRPDDFSWTKRLAVYLCVTLDSEPAGSCLQSTNENNTKIKGSLEQPHGMNCLYPSLSNLQTGILCKVYNVHLA